MEVLTPKFIKILKTCNLYFCFFTLGLCNAVPGPCLLDLQDLVQTDTQQISFIYIARSVGYLIGSILGGIILDAVKSKQAVMTISNFLVASSMLGIPWSRDLPTLTGFMVVNGLFLGAVDIGGNVVCLTIWGSENGPFYQALHFTFGLGGLVAPLIAAPFLRDADQVHPTVHEDNATYHNNFTGFMSGFVDSNSSISNSTIPDIVYPFSIIGGLGQIVTLTFLAICIISPTEGKRSQNKSEQKPNSKLGLLVVLTLLNFLLLFVETGIEIGYSQMLTTYVVKGRLKLASTTGSYMTSAFWAAFTASRLASVFLAIRVSSFTLILYDLGIIMVGSLVLLFLASYEWAIWLSSVLIGIGVASFFPAAITWMDTYITITNKIASVFTVGAAFGGMFLPFTISYFIESVPDILIYVVPASSVSASLIVLILYLILRKREKKSVTKSVRDKEPEYFPLSVPSVNT